MNASIMELLGSAQPDDRFAAAVWLADEPQPGTTQALLPLLSDRLEWVSRAALMALAEAEGEDWLVPVGQHALQDESDEIRLLANWLLSYRRHPAAFPILLQARNDPDSMVRAEALRGLRELAEAFPPLRPFLTPAGSPELEAREQAEVAHYLGLLHGEERATAALALTQIVEGGGGFPQLLEPFLDCLGDNDPEVHYAAVYGLVALSSRIAEPGPEHRAKLLQALTQASQLCLAAGRWQMDEAIPQILDWAQSKDSRAAATARWALTYFEDLRGTPHILRALSDPGAEARIRAADWLAVHHQGQHLQALLAALHQSFKNSDGEFLQALAQAVARFGQGAASAVPELITLVKKCHPKRMLRKPTDFFARHSLENSYGRLGAVLLEALCSLPLGKQCLPVLSEAFRSRHAAVRFQAVRALSRCQSDSALTEVIQGLGDRQVYVRVAAVTGLRDLANPAAIPSLQAIAGRPDPRDQAIETAASGQQGELREALLACREQLPTQARRTLQDLSPLR